jgi:hypothetical protein
MGVHSATLAAGGMAGVRPLAGALLTPVARPAVASSSSTRAPSTLVIARARFLQGPLAGGSFDDEDDSELTASTESALVDGGRGGWLARALRWRGNAPAPAPPLPTPKTGALTASVPVFDLADPTGARARALLAYVQGVSPGEAVDAFSATAPAEAVEAARAVSSGLVGALPRAFTVSIAAADEDVGQLLYSSLLTGYLMRNAAARLELDRQLLTPAGASPSPSPPSSSSSSFPSPSRLATSPSSLLPGGLAAPPTTAAALAASLATDAGAAAFAPGVQTDGVRGTALKWHAGAGVAVRVDAGEYIAALEAQLEGARLKLAGAGAGWASSAGAAGGGGGPAWPLAAALSGGGGASTAGGGGGNALLGLLRTSDAATLAGLTASASPGALEAANTFVGRLMGGNSAGGGPAAGGPAGGSHAAPDLAALVLLSLIVGWGLRSLEARFDLDQAMAA